MKYLSGHGGFSDGDDPFQQREDDSFDRGSPLSGAIFLLQGYWLGEQQPRGRVVLWQGRCVGEGVSWAGSC